MAYSSVLQRSLRRVAGAAVVASAVLSFAAVSASSAGAASVAPLSTPAGGCSEIAVGEFAGSSLLDTTESVEQLTTFGAALEAAGYAEDIETTGPLTVFAPSTAAFEAIPQNAFDALLADLDSLRALVGHHLVTGQALSPENLGEVGTVETLNGTVEATVAGDVVTVDGVVACPPIETADGIVYLIDEVLEPPLGGATGPCPSVPGSSVPGSSVPGSSVPPAGAPASSTPGSSAPLDC